MNENISKQIEYYLEQIIFSKTKNFNNPLPSENFLATKFKVTRQTARNSLLKLQNKGFIIAKKGGGYFINPNLTFIKIKSIGSDYKHKMREIIEIDNSKMDNIISNLNIEFTENKNDYFGYRKLFYNDDQSIDVYINSFICKKKLPEINIDFIKKSLIEFLSINKINLSMQINNVMIETTNDIDYKLFGNKCNQYTAVVYGMLISKENNIIEIFERRCRLEKFNQQFVKLY